MKTLLLALALVLSAPSLSHAADSNGVNYAVSGPLTLVDGNAFWGANFKVGYKLTKDWTIGGGTGFFIWHKSYDVPNTSSTQWFIPLMPEGYYGIDAGLANFHPYVGLGLGVAIVHTSISFGGSIPTATDTSVKFDGLLHAGARIGSEQHFFVDMGIGLLDGNFQFAPNIGWLF
jgi:opacity protein-like surface antigen